MTAAAPSADPLQEVEDLGPWFHNLHLPDGTETAPAHPLGDFPSWKWAQIASHIPADLSGWAALDIGCNAGFYSFELARRNANVTAIDDDAKYLRQAEWAVGKFGLQQKINFRKQQVHALARRGESFDIVLFMGVFYHLRYPLLALDTIATLKPRLMVFQSLTMEGGDDSSPAKEDLTYSTRHLLTAHDWPKMAFLENTFCGDPTNWWVPNHAAIMAMLRSAGFEVIARPGHEIYVCQARRQASPQPWVRNEWLAAVGLGPKDR